MRDLLLPVRAVAGALLVTTFMLLSYCRSADASPGSAAPEVVTQQHADASSPVVVDAGVPIASPPALTLAPLPSAGQLPDPAESPLAAIDDVKLLARAGWAATVFGVLLMLTKLAAYLSASSLLNVPVLGAVATWLAVGRRAVVVSGLGTVAAAGYNAVQLGGSWVAALLAAGVALAGVMTPTTSPRQPVPTLPPRS